MTVRRKADPVRHLRCHAGDVAVTLVGFVLLTVWPAPPLAVIVISALSGMALAQVES
jgi:hypothetical protein